MRVNKKIFTSMKEKNITLEESRVEIDLTPGVTSYGWITSTKTNPKESEGWLMFESNMKNVDSNYAVMKVIIDGDKYPSFTCYINSYAESSCDFTYCTKAGQQELVRNSFSASSLDSASATISAPRAASITVKNPSSLRPVIT